MNLTVNLLTRAVLAVVAGGSDDDHSLIDERTHCKTKRIVRIRVGGRHAETEIRDARVVACAVRQQPVKGGEYVGNFAGALRIQYAQVEQLGARRDADVLATRNDSVTSGCGSDVRAMSVG